MEQTIPYNSWKKRSRNILSKQVKMTTFNGSEAGLGMTSCIWHHRQVIMILFTYLWSKICLLLNTPVAVGTTLRCRRNSCRFKAGVPEKNSQIELYMVKGFGGRQYQKTTLASNPKRHYSLPCKQREWPSSYDCFGCIYMCSTQNNNLNLRY